MKIAIVIPGYNRKNKILQCLDYLDSIDKASQDVDAITVDDGSIDGIDDAVRERFPDTIILKSCGKLWWIGAINMGIQYPLEHDYDAVLLLNDDLKPAPDFIRQLMSVAELDKGALVSSLKLLEHDQPEIIPAGFYVRGGRGQIENNMQGERHDEQSLNNVLTCDMLTGAPLLMPLNVVCDVGLLNFSKFPHNRGDLEFTRRASLKGYKCLVATRLHIYMDYNPNFHRTCFITSSRIEYLKNPFDNRKYSYGFLPLFHRPFMHRSLLAGSALFIRGLLTLIRSIAQKILLPKSKLALYGKAQQLISYDVKT